MPIANMTEAQTAQVMRESLIFLSFGYPEGCPLPPAEAMSCGCIVIGYHGMGAREYFKPEFCFPVEMGDILKFAQTVEYVIRKYKEEPSVLSDMAQKASDFIRETYTPEREEQDVFNFWRQLIDRETLK
jgi:glycosyltransferase involved in cell wall biosynthesis